MTSAMTNMTDSPTYDCKSGGIPTIGSDSPYCIVLGGAPRMATCCAESTNNNNSTIEFYPDCYSWCHVDLAPWTGIDPLTVALRKFSLCLQEGQDPGYSPMMLCGNGTMKNDGGGDARTTSLSSSTSTPTTSMSSMPTAGTSTQPAVPTYTGAAVGGRTVGKGAKVLLGVAAFGAAVGAIL